MLLVAIALLTAAVAAAESNKPVFYDMKHSNNAARIRLWRQMKEGMPSQIERHVVTYPELKTAEFAALNPLKKVPALIRTDGTTGA